MFGVKSTSSYGLRFDQSAVRLAQNFTQGCSTHAQSGPSRPLQHACPVRNFRAVSPARRRRYDVCDVTSYRIFQFCADQKFRLQEARGTKQHSTSHICHLETLPMLKKIGPSHSAAYWARIVLVYCHTEYFAVCWLMEIRDCAWLVRGMYVIRVWCVQPRFRLCGSEQHSANCLFWNSSQHSHATVTTLINDK